MLITDASVDGWSQNLSYLLNLTTVFPSISPVLDKTLYLLSLVSFVSLLVQPIAEQDQFIDCFHTNKIYSIINNMCNTMELQCDLDNILKYIR